MRLGQIVLRIRSKNTYFGNFVGGAIELNTAIQNTLTKDMAFVIPLFDDAGRNNYDVTINQKIVERFAVICALANDTSQSDKLGFLAYDNIHNIRNELINALCGWSPLGAETPVYYRGSKLIDFNNGYIWYQFEFEFESRIIQDSIKGVYIQESDFNDEEIPVDFNTVYMQTIKTPDERIPSLDDFGEPNELLLQNLELPDLQNWIDLTKNENAGAFTKSFVSAFDIDKI